MNPDELRRLVLKAIQDIAPEIEESDIDPDADLREACDIDSMDFLNLLAALKKITGVSIPERDYNQISTFKSMLGYLADKSR